MIVIFIKLKTRTSFGIVGGIQFLFFSNKHVFSLKIEPPKCRIRIMILSFMKLKTRTSFGIVGGIQFLFFSKKTRIFSKNWPSRSWKQGRYLVLLRVSTFCLFSKQKLTCLQLREGQFLEKIRVYLKKTESGYPQQYQMTSLFSASWRSIFRENTCFFWKKQKLDTPNNPKWRPFFQLHEA